MSTLEQELEATWQTAAQPQPADSSMATAERRSLATELEASWIAPDEMHPAIYGNPIADVKALASWIAANPQAILDTVLQGAGTAGGIALGTLGGAASPATMPAGGAIGNVLGKQVSRRVGTALGLPDAQPAPDIASGETAIDAALGGIGPVANTIARGAGRVMTGLDPNDLRAAQRAGVGPGGLNAIAADETERALTAALTPTRQRALGSFGRSAPAAVGGAMMIEPITGSLAGLVTSEVVLSRAVPALLGSRFGEAFSRWALGASKQPRSEAAASLAAIFAGQQLTREERNALVDLHSAIAPTNGERRSLWRDQAGNWHARDGRFVQAPARGTLDHRGHPLIRDDDNEETEQ